MEIYASQLQISQANSSRVARPVRLATLTSDCLGRLMDVSVSRLPSGTTHGHRIELVLSGSRTKFDATSRSPVGFSPAANGGKAVDQLCPI
jgi:hypothetical protein